MHPTNDTIAAIATPSGAGALALVRVSGPQATAILARVCPSLRGELPPPRLLRLLRVEHPETGVRVDHALVCRFVAPHSYTGEDTLELSTHGGPLTPQLVLAALIAAGARLALPGEFTHRALANGKLDLLQAEAILDLVEARSEALHQVAVDQVERGLSRRIEELRYAILEAEALVAYSIDFPEEDQPPIGPDRIEGAARAVLDRVVSILATAPQGEMLREGALVVLAGRPNSGKSSLFNALLGFERAIVTEIPGTTRDALEASLSLDGYPFRLVDTAGLRQSVDPVERIGIEVAERYLRSADLVLFCVEAGRELSAEESAFVQRVDPRRVLWVRTKTDLSVPGSDGQATDGLSEVRVSAVRGEGFPELREALVSRSFGALVRDQPAGAVVTRERHTKALRRAADALEGFLADLAAGVPMELAATHLRAAAGALEDLIGVVTSDDVLAEVFGQFCVGK